jgi:NADPH:quinone reductase-like Zn-dependent oxidoreductase
MATFVPTILCLQGESRGVFPHSVYELKDTAEAHRVMEARKSLGKIVIRVS